jgi:tRNA U38,U39,U40 pseudouridine synthase TruA
MVRTIVGTIVKGVTEEYDESYIHNIISNRNRAIAWEAFPPKGLFLNKVRYK